MKPYEAGATRFQEWLTPPVQLGLFEDADEAESARMQGRNECRSDAQTSSGVTAPNEAEHV